MFVWIKHALNALWCRAVMRFPPQPVLVAMNDNALALGRAVDMLRRCGVAEGDIESLVKAIEESRQ